MYFLLIRPQKKKEKEINLMRSNLKVGDEIITIGGICGKIVKVKDETIVIQVGADKVKFEMMRWAVSKVEKAAEPKGGKSAAREEEKKPALPKKLKKESAEDQIVAEETHVEAKEEKEEVQIVAEETHHFDSEEDK